LSPCPASAVAGRMSDAPSAATAAVNLLLMKGLPLIPRCRIPRGPNGQTR
jgi:hypothetical protein